MGLGVLYYKVTSGQENLPQMADQLIREHTGLELDCGLYHFNYHEHFPFLALQMEEVSFAGLQDSISGQPLLEVATLSILFEPLKLVEGTFEVKRLVLKDGHIFFYQNQQKQRNTQFLDKSDDGGEARLRLLDDIQLENITLEYRDEVKPQHHQMTFVQARIQLKQHERGYLVQLESECFFDGLEFNPLKGPFLSETAGGLQAEVVVDTRCRQLLFKPSVLSVNGLDIDIEGYMELREQGWLELHIEHPAVTLAQGLPILNPRLRNKLSHIHSDATFEVAVHLGGNRGLPGKIPLNAYFATEGARLSGERLWISKSRIRGYHDNTCDNTGGAADTLKCLDVFLEEGQLFGKFPVQAHIKKYGAEDAPLQISGLVEGPLPGFNEYLSGAGLRFGSGYLRFPFELTGDPTALFNDSEALETEIKGRVEVKDGQLEYAPNKLKISGVDAIMALNDRDLRVDSLSFDIQHTTYNIKGFTKDLLPMALQKKHQFDARFQLEVDTLMLDAFFPKEGTGSNDKDTLSMARLESFGQKGNIALEVNAGQLSFRKLAVDEARFTAFLIQNCEEQKACLKIADFKGFAYDSIALEADLAATNLQYPWINMNLDIRAPLQQFSRLSPPGQLSLESGQLDINLLFDGRLADYFGLKEDILSGGFEGKALLRDAYLQYLPLEYQFEEMNASLRFDEKELFVDSLNMRLNGNELMTDGYIHNFTPFLFQDAPPALWASLNIQSPRIDFSTLEYASGTEVENQEGMRPTVVTRSIQNVLDQIEGTLSVQADELIFRSFHMTEVSFTSELFRSCEEPNEAVACVDIDGFAARLWGTAPLEADLSVVGLKNPFFDARVAVQMPLGDINRMFPPGRFQFKEGEMRVNFTYKGYPNDQFDVKKNLLKADIRGEASIRSGGINYRPRGFQFRDMNGTFRFDEEGLKIDQLTTLLNQNYLEVAGNMPNFMPFLLEPGQRLITNLELKSPHLSFDRFKAPQKFANQSEGNAAAPTQLTSMVDAALGQIKAQISVELDTVSYRKFLARQLDGNFTLQPDFLRFNDVNMKLADGRLAMNGQISGVQDHQPQINLRAKFDAVDIQKVFYAFENFGQGRLLAENIEGNLNADINFQTSGNANYDLDPQSQSGVFHLEIRDGALKEFPALQAMSGFMFKNRDMDDVQFANLENTFTLEGEMLKIDHFYVVSNVLDFGLQGQLSLGEAEKTRLLFEVPVSNIFRRDLEIEGAENTKGRSRTLPILLEAREKDGELDFRFRLFRGKWAK